MDGDAIPLTALPPHTKARIVSVRVGWGKRRRLMELGLIPGEEIIVLSNSVGPLVVRVRGGSLALGRGIASKILVEVIK